MLLTGAAGIELQPLPIGVVTRYLRDSSSETGASGRWDAVIASLTAPYPPPAAQVLTTPLMAALARVAYNPRPGEEATVTLPRPSELLDVALFPSTEAVEDNLFDRFIPASYRPHPGSAHPSRRYNWTPKQAERWLVFIARNLEDRQGGSTDIAWWKLPTAAPKHLAGSLIGVIAGLAFALGYPFPGFGLGLTVGIVTGLAARRWLRIGKDGLGLGMAGGVVGGTFGGLVVLIALGARSTEVVGALLSGGLAVGISMSLMSRFAPALLAGFAGQVTIGFYENSPALAGVRLAVGPGYHVINAFGAWLTALLFVELVGRKVPARGIRWSPTWFAVGLICAVIVSFIAWIQAGALAAIVVGLAATAASGLVAGVAESVATDLAGAANPDAVLRRDRTTFLASWLGLGVAIGAAIGLAQALGLGPSGHPNGFWFGARIGGTTFVTGGLVFGFVQAMWAPFAVARVHLAASRRLPWRLMAFLRDAHANRGVLRQAGAVYQFRHVELQRRLARRHSGPVPSAITGQRAPVLPAASAITAGLPGRKLTTAEAVAGTTASLRAKPGDLAGHAFISYAREDWRRADQLQGLLEAAGIPTWRDTASLWPGEDWRMKVRQAITDGALVFIACFSRDSLRRGKGFRNEELTLAIEQLRLRQPDDPWLIPVRFDPCEIPDRDIGAGRTLRSIQRADLFGDRADVETARLVAAILRILGRPAAEGASPGVRG